MCPKSSSSTTSVKDEAANLLGSGIKPRDTALALNLDESTISKWNRDPEFIAKIEERRSNQVSEIREKLLDIFKKAIPNLEQIVLGDPDCKGFGKTLEIISRSIGLLDKQLDVTNCYRYKSHLDRDRFLEHHEEMGRLFDKLSNQDKQYVTNKLKALHNNNT